MDLMGAIHDFNNSPEQRRAKAARRELRQQLVYSRIAQATGRVHVADAETAAFEAELDTLLALSRTAAGWNIPVNEEVDDGSPIGSQHPGAAALTIVRHALTEYAIPTEIDLRYHGMKRASGHGAFGVHDGIIYVQATLHSVSGPRHHVDIPVIMRKGRVLAPSILLHQGSPRIMTQHTFDDIIGMGEFTQQAPDRPTMFAPPPDKDAARQPRRAIPRLSPNMFKPMPSRTMIRGALTGIYQAQVRGGPAVQSEEDYQRSLRDHAEQYQQKIQPQPAPQQPAPQGPAQPAAPGLTPDQLDQQQYDQTGYSPLRGRNTRPLQGPRTQLHQQTDDMNRRMDQTPPGVRSKHTIDPNWKGARRQADWDSIAPEPDPAMMQEVMALATQIQKQMRCDMRQAILEALDQLAPAGSPQHAMMAHLLTRRGFYNPDVTGLVENGSTGASIPGAGGSHLDVAERPTKDMLAPGQRVRIKSEATARDRGGVAYPVPRGTRGVVVRDVDGAGRAYYVKFDDLGFSATVPREALSG